MLESSESLQEKRVACAGIVDHLGRVLLQDRSGRSKYGEAWSFFGGWIEDGETPLDGLLRELREELDWRIQETDAIFLGETEHVLPDRGLAYRRFVFAVPTDRSEEFFTDLEASWARFFDLPTARTLVFNTDVNEELDLFENFLIDQARG